MPTPNVKNQICALEYDYKSQILQTKSGDKEQNRIVLMRIELKKYRSDSDVRTVVSTKSHTVMDPDSMNAMICGMNSSTNLD